MYLQLFDLENMTWFNKKIIENGHVHLTMLWFVERNMSSHLCQSATQFEDPSWGIHGHPSSFW
jgi:hypothetical protein